MWWFNLGGGVEQEGGYVENSVREIESQMVSHLTVLFLLFYVTVPIDPDCRLTFE